MKSRATIDLTAGSGWTLAASGPLEVRFQVLATGAGIEWLAGAVPQSSEIGEQVQPGGSQDEIVLAAAEGLYVRNISSLRAARLVLQTDNGV